MQRQQVAAYLRAAAISSSPPAEQKTYGCHSRGFEFQWGNLRLPHALSRHPNLCVLLNPGADSTKGSIFTALEKRVSWPVGVATFSYDGPGQGLTWANI